jgi:O-antigen ligase
LALVVVGIAMGLQLLPLPDAMIASISPQTDAFLRRYTIGYGSSLHSHALSIRPPATVLALGAFTSLSIFLLGSARCLTDDDTHWIAGGVTVIGVVLALVALAQKAMWNGKLYGFWVPEQVGSAFGPFNNHNHFAGWMLMALALALGLLCGRTVTGIQRVRQSWRSRLLWLSSSEANRTILLGFAILVMAFALVATLSRSGMLGLLVTIVVLGWLVVRRQPGQSRRTLTAAYLMLVVLVAAGWTGLDLVASRFNGKDVFDIGGRIGPWLDTWHIAQRFPLTGTGANTYGVATIFFQAHDVTLHYAEAHNDYLQLLAEGGALLCIPIALVVVMLSLAVRRRFLETPSGSDEYWLRVGAVTGILAIALQETSDFSLQMPGNALLFAVLLAIALRQSPTRRTARARDRITSRNYSNG